MLNKQNKIALALVPLPLAMLAMLATAIAYRADLGAQWHYFFGAEADVALRFDQISEEWDEAALRAALPNVVLNCQDVPGPRDERPRRACSGPAHSMDGLPAFGLAAELAGGRLIGLRVYQPTWSHERTQARLDAEFGASQPHADLTFPNGTFHSTTWTRSDGSSMHFMVRQQLLPVGFSGVEWNPRRH